MTKPIISVRNISKAYKLYANPADRLKEALWPWKQRHSLFYALHDVSFDVRAGEHLGIVGLNGAGKSTLLQILTGVLVPTSGTIEVNGRVSALLELGAGFNPDLSGRENAFFQMQIADVPASDIAAKIAAVESFADVGEFFDQPTKLYSSGMFARVAFACAILTEPDILIVDEALAVGDARFQKKCADRMRVMKENGVTILLVSHDIFGTKAASSQMVLLDKGRLKAQGVPEDVTAEYMKILFPKSEQPDPGTNQNEPEFAQAVSQDEYVLRIDPGTATNVWGQGGAALTGVRCYGLMPPNRFIAGQTFAIECDYIFDPQALHDLASLTNVPASIAIGMRMDTEKGFPLCDFSSAALGAGEFDFAIADNTNATFRFEATLPVFVPGTYFFTPEISIGNVTSYTPVRVYENTITLVCESQEIILGLFKPDYSIKMLR